MRRLRAILPILSLSSVAFAAPCMAQGFGLSALGASTQCRSAVRSAERSGAIPGDLLAAIARVESGRRDPQTGRTGPWPWTINAEGQGYFFETKSAAIAAVRDLQARGVRSIDVGCMQINLMHHPDAFASLEQAFDPPSNAAYAARFLNQLHAQSGDWGRATASYHSATPDLGADYQRKVLAVWPEEKQNQATAGSSPSGAGQPSALANAWASTMPEQGGRVAVSLSSLPGGDVRIMSLGGGGSGGGGATQGRGLDAYRAAPIAIASRLTRGLGG